MRFGDPQSKFLKRRESNGWIFETEFAHGAGRCTDRGGGSLPAHAADGFVEMRHILGKRSRLENSEFIAETHKTAGTGLGIGFIDGKGVLGGLLFFDEGWFFSTAALQLFGRPNFGDSDFGIEARIGLAEIRGNGDTDHDLFETGGRLTHASLYLYYSVSETMEFLLGYGEEEGTVTFKEGTNQRVENSKSSIGFRLYSN